MDLELRIDGPAAAPTLVLAHGAGAGMDTPFLNHIAQALAARGLRVVRFEFPYMARRRRQGKGGPPDSQPVLLETWRQVLRAAGTPPPIIGGKSMGGRMASMIADEATARGLVCLGYPFHPIGKPDQLRIEHLRTLRTPTLILQGERDPFGNRAEVGGYPLSAAIRVHWLPDGDHDLKPRRTSGRTLAQNWEEAVEQIAAFAATLNPG